MPAPAKKSKNATLDMVPDLPGKDGEKDKSKKPVSFVMYFVSWKADALGFMNVES